MKRVNTFLLVASMLLGFSHVIIGQCDVDPSWVITPSSLNISYNSSDFAQGTVCPGANPFIDPSISGTPTAEANDSSPDCDISQLTIDFQDTWSSSNTDDDCMISISRLWKATYAQINGGTGQVSGIQEIQIIDDVPPSITCPSSITIELSNLCDETDPNVETFSGYAYGSESLTELEFLSTTNGAIQDNCDTNLEISFQDGPVSVLDGNCPDPFITWDRVWTVTDNCGFTDMCVQEIAVYDNSVPDFSSILPDFDENMMITACDVFDPAIEATTGYPFNETTSTTVTEAELSAIGGFVVDNCKLSYPIEYSYIDVYFDLPGNCPGELGQIYRLWTATDHCGNVGSDRQEIFIYDNVGPVVSGCPADVQIFVFSPESCDQNNPQIESLTGYEFSFSGTSIADPNDFPGSAFDNCDGANIAEVSYQDEVTQSGCISGSDVSFEITRTWSVFDACGNATTCEQLIQLIDNEAPVLIGGANFFLDQDFSNPVPMVFETVACEMEVAWLDPTASDVFDNCESFDDLVIWKSHESPFLFREGVTEIEYVYRDACGNQTSIVWEVVIVCVPCTPQNVYFTCDSPPTICDFSEVSSFSSCTPAPIGPEPNFYLCDEGQFIDNPTYFEFVAGESDISIIYLVENCSDGGGVEIAIIDPCDPLSCFNLDKLECVNGFGNVLASNLTVGNIYQLLIDGCMGDQCEYTISVASGPFEFPDFQSQPLDISSLTSLSCHPDDFRLCQGQQVAFFPEGSGDAIFNFCWSIDNQNGVTALNNQDNCGQAVVGTPQGLAFSCSDDYSSCGPLELQFDEVGTYRLCLIEVENGCDHADLDDYCWDIEVVPNGPLDFGTHYVCATDFPWSVDVQGPNGEAWPGPALYPGEEIIIDTDYCGCTYEYMIDVRMLPQLQGEGDVRVCYDERENWQDPILDVDWEDLMDEYVPPAMGSEVFVSFGSSQQGYDGDYCDTMVFYNIYVYDLPGQIIEEPGPACDAILTFEIDTLLFPEFMDDEELNFVWKDAMGGTVDVGTAISIEQDGLYTLEVEYEIDEWTTCKFVFVAEVMLDNQMLAAPTFVEAPTQTCFNATDGLIFSVPSSALASYTWTVSNGTFITNATGEEITVSITDPNIPLQVNVFANSQCGTSPTQTTSLNVVPAPVIELLPVQDVCVGQPILINSNVISGNVDDYFWIVDDPTASWDMVGSGNQESIEVTWSNPGLQSYSLYIDDIGGCESNIVTGLVNVLEPIGPPIVNCIPTSSTSITIDWQEDGQASSTEVLILSGQTGVQNSNQYIVSGLTPGEIVQFSLQNIGANHPCGDGEVILFECEASDCNLNPSISTPLDLICLDGTQSEFQLQEDNGFPGGVWSGIGVSPDGIFDPTDAGPGTWTITYTVEDLINDCSAMTSLSITVVDGEIQEFMINVDSLCIDEVATISFENLPGLNYSWDFDEGSNNPSTLTSSFDISYSTPGLKYIELSVDQVAGCGSVFGVEVFVKPPLDFDGVFCYNLGEDLIFEWVQSDQVLLYEADLLEDGMISNQFTFDANGSNTISLSDFDPNQTFEVVLTAYDAFGCGDVITSATCVTEDCQDFEVDIEASSLVECWDPTGIVISLSQMTFDESGNIATGMGEWIGNDVDSETGLFTPSGPGVYVLRYLFTDDLSACSASGEIQIEILEEPSSDFDVLNQELCIEETLVLQYQGTYNGAIDFLWTSSLDDSEYILLDNQDGTFSVEFLTAASASFGLITTIGDCSSDLTSMSVEVQDVPTLPVVSCETTLNSVLFSWEEVPCAEFYVITLNGMQLAQTQDLSILVEDLNESEVVEIEIEVTSSCLCEFPNTIIESCNAQACEPAIISFESGIEQSFCISELPNPFNIQVEVEGVEIDGSGSFQWSGIGVDPEGLIDLGGLGAGSYPLIATYEENGCSYMETIVFEIFEEPSMMIEVTDAPCEENPFGVVDFIVDAVEPFALSINNESVLETNNQLEAGSYEVILVDGLGCEIVETFSIEIESSPFASLDGPGFIKLDSMGLFTFSLSDSPTTLTWTLNNEVIAIVDCLTEDCSGLEYDATVSGDYELCVSADYGEGCVVTECFNFLVASVAISDIYIPNVFNPESENVENQSLNLFVTGFDVVVEEVSIFDRWGSIVYNDDDEMSVSSGSFANLWDGDFGDKEFMTGVYVYLVKISIDGEQDYLVGDVSVLK